MTTGHLRPNAMRRGFTLIELLVVIAIIGLLSTLAVVSLSSARAKARDAQRVAAVTQLKTALELYRSDNLKGADGYPNPTATVTAVVLGDTDHACLDAAVAGFEVKTACGANGAAVHMQQVQADPLSGQEYHYYGFKSDGTNACTPATDLCQSYLITFQLEGAASGNFGKGWNCVSDKLPGGTKTVNGNGVSAEVTTAANCKL